MTGISCERVRIIKRGGGGGGGKKRGEGGGPNQSGGTNIWYIWLSTAFDGSKNIFNQ